MARLDELGPVKELAQLGAVLGREFSYDLLLKVSPMKQADLEPALAAAVREELFYQRGTPPEATYLFKHALIRDTAYQSMVRATRHRHHARVAETLIERMPEVVEEQPELVAHHWTEAGDAEQAVAWWLRAGEQAAARVAYEEAIRDLRRGLSLLEQLPAAARRERELALQVVLARALWPARGAGHAETMRAWDRAHALCDPASDPMQAGAICYGLATGSLSAGDPRTVLEYAAELLRIGETAGDPMLEIASYRAGAGSLVLMGKLARSRDDLERAVSLYDPERHRFVAAGFPDELGVTAYGWLAVALWLLGFPDRARESADRAIGLARQLEQPYSLAWVLSGLAGFIAVWSGDWARAKALGVEGAQICEEQGFSLFEAFSRIVAAQAAALEDGEAEALPRLTAAMGQAAKAGNRGALPMIVGMLARLQLRLGHLEDALGAADAALGLGDQTHQNFWDSELNRLKGEICLELEGHTENEAEALFRDAIELARSQQARSFELLASISLARLWQRQGKRTEARDLLQPVYDWFSEGFDTQDLKDAKALLEQLARA